MLTDRKADIHMQDVVHPDDFSGAAISPTRKHGRIRPPYLVVRTPALSGSKLYFLRYRLGFGPSSSGADNRMSRSCTSCITTTPDKLACETEFKPLHH
jgi:hypothetical protein